MALRTTATLLLAAIPIAIGCGDGGDEGIGEAELRDCLAAEGMKIEAAGPASSAPLGIATADFRAVADGLPLEVLVERDEERAARTAADLPGALGALGVADADERLIARRNVIVVFDGDPSGEQRDAVISCLD